MKKAARAEREKAKKEKMELERAARIQSLVPMNFDRSTDLIVLYGLYSMIQISLRN